ncbi:MAG: hypothetical protein FRX49_07663 [Trebouxia sp. A1-2]|nr:MAG: hypothetical protein FRX49_07663 [Trebouxia sp. A1-2]
MTVFIRHSFKILDHLVPADHHWTAAAAAPAAEAAQKELLACPRALRYPFERLLGHTLSGKVTWMLPLGKGKGMMSSHRHPAEIDFLTQPPRCSEAARCAQKLALPQAKAYPGVPPAPYPSRWCHSSCYSALLQFCQLTSPQDRASGLPCCQQPQQDYSKQPYASAQQGRPTHQHEAVLQACWNEEPEMHVKGSSDRRIRIKQWYRTPWSRRQQQKTVGSSERHLEGIQLGLQVRRDSAVQRQVRLLIEHISFSSKSLPQGAHLHKQTELPLKGNHTKCLNSYALRQHEKARIQQNWTRGW